MPADSTEKNIHIYIIKTIQLKDNYQLPTFKQNFVNGHNYVFHAKVIFLSKKIFIQNCYTPNCMLKDLTHARVHSPVYWQLIWRPRVFVEISPHIK